MTNKAIPVKDLIKQMRKEYLEEQEIERKLKKRKLKKKGLRESGKYEQIILSAKQQIQESQGKIEGKVFV